MIKMGGFDMHEEFVDDRTDMQEIRTIMKKVGTNPKFSMEFRRNSNNDIVIAIFSDSTTMPPIIKKLSTLNDVGQHLIDYIQDTAIWV